MRTFSKINNYFLIMLLAASVLITAIPQIVGAAGVTLYEKEDKYVKIGGRIQLQYHHQDPKDDGSSDKIFFRRLRPYIEGSIHEDWKGKFQIDFGKAVDGDEVAIKDAYLQYKVSKILKSQPEMQISLSPESFLPLPSISS